MERKVSHYAIESADRPSFGITSIPTFLIADSVRRGYIRKKVWEEDSPERAHAEDAWVETVMEMNPVSDHDGQKGYRHLPGEAWKGEIEVRVLNDDEITIRRAAIQAGVRTDSMKLQIHKQGFPTYKVRIPGSGANGKYASACDVCSREHAQIVVMDLLSRKK